MIERKTVGRRVGHERFEMYAAAAWRVVADGWIWLLAAAVLAGDLLTGQVAIGIVVLMSAVATAGLRGPATARADHRWCDRLPRRHTSSG
jgi:hypothetical protein